MCGGRGIRKGKIACVAQRGERSFVEHWLAIREIAGGPAVIRRRFDLSFQLEEGILGQLVTQVVVAHVGGEERSSID